MEESAGETEEPTQEAILLPILHQRKTDDHLADYRVVTALTFDADRV